MAKILFINEDPKTIQTMKDHLIAEGYDVSVVHRAQDGITTALTSKPDVIFVDPILPGVTGSQICFKLRRNAVTRRTPIIMLDETGDHPAMEQFARAMGVTEFVNRPMKVIELGEMVGRYVHVGSNREDTVDAIIYLDGASPTSADPSQVEPSQLKMVR